jgi:hypothetical protein
MIDGVEKVEEAAPEAVVGDFTGAHTANAKV